MGFKVHIAQYGENGHSGNGSGYVAFVEMSGRSGRMATFFVEDEKPHESKLDADNVLRHLEYFYDGRMNIPDGIKSVYFIVCPQLPAEKDCNAGHFFNAGKARAKHVRSIDIEFSSQEVVNKNAKGAVPKFRGPHPLFTSCRRRTASRGSNSQTTRASLVVPTTG